MTTFTFRHGSSTFNIPTCSNISQKMSARSWENFTVWDLTACTPHACEDGRVLFHPSREMLIEFLDMILVLRNIPENLSVKCHNYCRLKAKQPRFPELTWQDPQVDPGIGKDHRQNSHQELFVRGVRGAERHVTEIDDAVKAVFLGHGRNAWCKVMQRGRSLDSFEMHVSCWIACTFHHIPLAPQQFFMFFLYKSTSVKST